MIANAQKGIWVKKFREAREPRRRNEQTTLIGFKAIDCQKQRQAVLR